MQRSDFDSPSVAHLAMNELPLDSQDFGNLNALPNELISLIFDQLTVSELNSLKLVSHNFKNWVSDSDAFKARRIAIQNFEHLHASFEQLSQEVPYKERPPITFLPTEFILDKEGNLVALSVFEIKHFINKEKNVDTRPEEHTSLTIEWPYVNFGDSPQVAGKMSAAEGFVKKVGDEMFLLAPLLFEGAQTIAKRPEFHRRWYYAFLERETCNLQEILEIGKKALGEKDNKRI